MKRFSLFFPSGVRWLMMCLVLGLAAWRGQAAVVINQVLADNQTVITNGSTVIPFYPDYVELFNTSEADVDLAGWIITENLTNRYTFKTNAIVEAGNWKLVYFDKQTNASEIHTGFTLSRNGTRVQLIQIVETLEVLQDEVTFGFQLPDLSIGRVPDGTGAFTLTRPSVGKPNEPVALGDPFKLKINEWSALNGTVTKPKSDWFELYNPDTNAVAFGGFVFTDAPDLVPATNNRPVSALSFIAGGGYMPFFADKVLSGPDHVDFKLSSTLGSPIALFDDTKTNIIDRVDFGPQQLNISEGRLPDGLPGTNYQRFSKLTPGASNFQPLTNIVINEVLTHTDAPLEDAIELYNPGTTNVDVSGWWMSNRKDNPFKYQIPAGTIVAGRGYKVFYEKDFDPDYTGNAPSFRLNSAQGDSLYLFTGRTNDALLTGLFRGVSFDSAANGVTFGRYLTSDGKSDFVAMSDMSLGTSVRAGQDPSLTNLFRTGRGATNLYPKVGPIVINEIHYRPPDDIVSGVSTNDNFVDEFIELYNMTGSGVPLFDPNLYAVEDDVIGPDNEFYSKDTIYADGRTNTWRLRGEVDFDFPQGITLGAGQYLLVVNFDPAEPTNATLRAAFRSKFNVPNTVSLYGPYKGKLANGGADVNLFRPDQAQGPQHPDFRFVPYILVDHIKYSDAAPWPISADGGGDSLQRITARNYGNDVINWKGAEPTAGRSSAVPPSFTVQPPNRTNNAGTAVSFPVTIKGTAPFGHQWFFNGVEMEGKTNLALTLADVQPADAGGYSIVVMNDAASVTSVVATLTVNCLYTIAPVAASSRTAGGISNFTVITARVCAWEVNNTNDWITITSATSGVGTGRVDYAVAANDSVNTRSGNIVVGGRAHLVTQANCTYTTAPAAASYRSMGGVSNITVATDAVCSWAVVNTNDWITITSAASGVGAGSIDYSVAANDSETARSGTIVVAGRPHLVMQGKCSYTTAPATASFKFIGGTSNITVTTESVCSWDVVNTNAWIEILSHTNGQGSGIVTYRVTTNRINFLRKGNIVVAGRPHLVTEFGLEQTKPTLTILSPLPNARIYSNSVTVRGTAADDVGVARVECQVGNMSPLEAVGTTKWSFDMALMPGTNTVTVKAIDYAGNESIIARRSFFHVETNRLTVVMNALPALTNRPGTILPAYNGKYLEINRGYSVTASNVNGWLFSNWVSSIEGVESVVGRSPTLKFLMTNDLVLMANFVANPFIPIKGTYNGLFAIDTGGDPFPPPPEHESSGAFTLTVMDRGAYSGRVTLAGKPYPVAGQFDLDGLATNRVLITRSNGFNVEWHLALTPGIDMITGRVTNGVWESVLGGERTWFHAVTNKATNITGKYTLAILGTDAALLGPQGDSYATAFIDLAGNVAGSGMLADNTAFAFKVPLARSGFWPLYVPLYAGKGSLRSWVLMTNDVLENMTGDAHWFRPPIPAVAYYRNGFTNRFPLTGSRYVPPARATNNVLNFTNGVGLVDFSFGNTLSSITNAVFVLPNNKMSNAVPTAMTMLLTVTNGIFSGTAILPGRTNRIPFKGVWLPTNGVGRGFFLGTNESGRVYFQQAP